MLEQLRDGDVIIIWKLDRLARSLKDLVSLVNEIQEKGAGLHSLNDHIDTSTPNGKLTFHLFAAPTEHLVTMSSSKVIPVSFPSLEANSPLTEKWRKI